MPTISMSIPHSLGQAEATRRIQGIAETLKQQYAGQYSDLQENWNGSSGEISMKAMGFNVGAKFNVTETAVDVEGVIPMMAIPFKGQIEQMISERAAALLA